MIAETLEDLWERMRRRPARRWILLGMMALTGVAAQIWIVVAGAGGVPVVGIVAVLLGVALVRTIVPLLVAGLFVVEATALDLSVAAMVPLAVALLGWHACAAALSIGQPWTRLSRAVIGGFRAPVAAAMVSIGLGAGAALAVSGLTLDDAPVVTVLAVLLVLAGGTVVLWPSSQPRR